jgi:hypothetical protein
MIWLYIYLSVSIVFGAIAAIVEIWLGEGPFLPRSDGRGWFRSPRVNAIGLGVFVAALWPLLILGMLL